MGSMRRRRKVADWRPADRGQCTAGLHGRRLLAMVAPMLRFRLGRISVHVHASHVLVSALLGYAQLPGPAAAATFSAAWPYPQLANPSHPDYLRTAVLYVLMWMGLLFLTIFVHELGHALARVAFGERPSISLAWLGGHTHGEVNAPIPWQRDALQTAAGPLAGLLLGFGAWALRTQVGGFSEVGDFFLRWLVWTTSVWTVLHLLPLLPLDGGRLLATLSTRVAGQQGFLASQGLALVVCAAVVAFSAALGHPFWGLLFFLLYGLRPLRLLSAGLRGERLVPPSSDEPQVQALQQARQALEAGDLEEARRLAEQLLEKEDTAPEVDSQAHHLLGWVALKQGQGRAALDHFSQVHGRRVEPQALAAAFSLVGDEPRALALWDMAWNETHSPTVLHEYAGALIRSGRVRQALGLQGIDPAAAFACATRVLFLRGAYSEAAEVGERALDHVPRADLAYEAACAHAQARHRDDAVRLLRRATELGFSDAAYASSDADLAPLHGHPGFESWLTGLRESALA